ncbi:MAG: DUF1080 domain-containing protein [Cytophagia bacterium]|nr:DUF1080 domain-containing protein [Cytophagia bacterium]
MKKLKYILILQIGIIANVYAQLIPIDTAHWDISANAYMIEPHGGVNSIYLQAGTMLLKDQEFSNGTIEFDIWLKPEQSFPGIYFRLDESTLNAEEFYIRPHLPGKPDANQVGPMFRGLAAWQLNFGPKYSFPYEYHYDDWTHVKIVVVDDKAQVFLDHGKEPNLSWFLFTENKSGKIVLRGGNQSGMHIANIRVNHERPQLLNFNPIERGPVEGLIENWEISEKFEEQVLSDPTRLSNTIKDIKWQGILGIDEGTAANISRIQKLNDGKAGNTVFARVIIESDKAQMKRLDFGYSDRVMAILNGKPIYQGDNGYRSRDYRYLGTIGFFDSIFLDLKKGRNELLMAVSESFGGWLITGKFKDSSGLKITVK